VKRHLTGPEQAVFGPEIVQLMSGALDDAWQSLRDADATLADDTKRANAREILARRIIELTTEGERDRRRLRDGALAAFGRWQLANSLKPSNGSGVAARPNKVSWRRYLTPVVLIVGAIVTIAWVIVLAWATATLLATFLHLSNLSVGTTHC
jgi:hypothetical protein